MIDSIIFIHFNQSCLERNNSTLGKISMFIVVFKTPRSWAYMEIFLDQLSQIHLHLCTYLSIYTTDEIYVLLKYFKYTKKIPSLV